MIVASAVKVDDGTGEPVAKALVLGISRETVAKLRAGLPVVIAPEFPALQQLGTSGFHVVVVAAETKEEVMAQLEPWLGKANHVFDHRSGQSN